MCKRKKLKVFRIEHDLTQEELANQLGISVAHYGSVERGIYDPSYKMMATFFKLYPDQKFEIFEKEEQKVNIIKNIVVNGKAEELNKIVSSYERLVSNRKEKQKNVKKR